MTQTLNPNDTGDIPRGATDETIHIVLDDPGATQPIRPDLITAPFPALRRQIDETAVIRYPVTIAVIGGDPSLTGEILALDTGGYPPVPKPAPPKPKHATWTGRVGEFPTVRPAGAADRPRIRGGRHRRPVSRLGWALVGSGLTVLLTAAAVGVSALLGVQW